MASFRHRNFLFFVTFYDRIALSCLTESSGALERGCALSLSSCQREARVAYLVAEQDSSLHPSASEASLRAGRLAWWLFARVRCLRRRLCLNAIFCKLGQV